MNRLVLILPVLLLILSGCQTTTISDAYTTFKGIPCYFHNARIGAINRNATLGSLANHCRPTHRGYKTKRGQTVTVERGTPVYAVADMTLINALNRSAGKRCKGSVHSQRLYDTSCKEPFDDLELEFKDELGNFVMFYHLMSDNPFVPGFGKGECTIPEMWRQDKWKRYPYNCGGIVKRKVNKGELIGWSGATGMGKGEHFAFAIKVMNHPDFPNEQGWIIPSNALTWENIPSENNEIYLLPLKKQSLSKKDRLNFITN
uniref:Uncharacterized protein n=1 Tax=uncultured marine microorganism HF4000_APKG2J17 TaxID=455546 RepID=B3T6N5_9ZZZZ|nr:hypothetical protein ALOHA_HF4000APKG2J17ctg1g51 [uncultured marine microorganism HF4000_APKG2J17]